MHNDPVEYQDEDSSKPLVEWYSRRGPVGSVTPEMLAAAGLAFGVFIAGAVAVSLLRRALGGGGGSLRELEVDRLIVRKLQVKDHEG